MQKHVLNLFLSEYQLTICYKWALGPVITKTRHRSEQISQENFLNACLFAQAKFQPLAGSRMPFCLLKV